MRFAQTFQICAALVLTLLGQAARAEVYVDCKAPQQEAVELILPGAEDLALYAAASVRNDEIYGRWFGTFADKYAEDVRGNLKRIHKVFAREDLTFICGADRSVDCDGVYAYVYSTEPFRVTLCPDFFEMPSIVGGSSDDPAYENGTMEGTLIHEISHFDAVGATEDHCYSRTDCSAMAEGSPQEAVENADSYQYFAEDIVFSLVEAQAASVEDKPE